MKTKVIVVLVLIGLFILFVMQNMDVVNINFLFFSFPISRVLLMFLIFAIGVVVGLMLPSVMKKR